MTTGKGSNGIYGKFWDGDKVVYAHHWAAINLHGLDPTLPLHETDHCCKPRPNSLCIQHLRVIGKSQNRKLAHTRGSRVPLEERTTIEDGHHEPPDWFKPFMDTDGNKGTDDECPF